MITSQQCRAARGLLGWTQGDLGKEAGLSKTAINNFERGLSAPKGETLTIIEQAFLRAGVEFIERLGVCMKKEKVQILKGDDCHTLLLDDILDTIKKQKGGEILIHKDHYFELMSHHCDKWNAYREEFKQLAATERVIASEGEPQNETLQNHRWVAPDTHSAVTPIIIYGDKIAIQLLPTMIVTVQSQDASDAERKRFDRRWNKAKTVR